MADLAIEELRIPETVGAPGWDEFAAVVAVHNRSEAHAAGTTDITVPPEERLPHWHAPDEGGRLFAARLDGRIVGRAVTRWDDAHPEIGWLNAEVDPAVRGLGIGRALADALDAACDELGQTRRLAYVTSAPAGGPQLDAPTGFGSVPLDNPEVRFLLARGYRLEQVERASRFALPGDAEALARHRAEAESHAAGYRVHTWDGITPDRFLAGMAVLSERMSTDAPTAGLDEPPEQWTPEKVTEQDERLTAATHLLTTAVEHEESGELAGYTRLSVPRAPGTVLSQWDTIVRREDRGHRLGMLLKVVNLQEVTARFPGHPSVVTYNAEENRPMLSVNEAVGFVPISSQGAWRRDVRLP
jgi:GNAT superfamily N-acetyltransferase/predicted GNAT family N-acyltransferase